MSTNSAYNDSGDIYPGGFPSNFNTSGFVIGNTSNVTWSNATPKLENNEGFQELKTRVSAIEDQLLILRPDIVMQEKYPALKEAYDAYQVTLKLVKDNAKIQK